MKKRRSTEDGQVAAAHQPTADFRPKQSFTRKVLVIDDSPMLLRFVEEVLIEANYQVVIAPNAEEGLRASKADPPDLILLDYILPDLRGDEVSRKLLEDPATADIPVVCMSGLGPDFKTKQIANANEIGFLNKPFTSEPARLMSQINQQLAGLSFAATRTSFPCIGHCRQLPRKNLPACSARFGRMHPSSYSRGMERSFW